MNNCGTDFFKPGRVPCSLNDLDGDLVSDSSSGCDSEISCSSWSECEMDVGFEDLTARVDSILGVRSRECSDSCSGNYVEEEECSLYYPVLARAEEFCDEVYVSVYDGSTSQILARILNNRGEDVRSDVSFVSGREESYCDFCFNGVRDSVEEGVDCGGEYCPSCEDSGDYSISWFDGFMKRMEFV